MKAETVRCPHLSLQSSDNLLPSLRDCFRLARDHDRKALVLCERQLQVSSRLLHDVKADLGLLAFSQLIHVLVFPLLQWHMEHLLSHGTDTSRAQQGVSVLLIVSASLCNPPFRPVPADCATGMQSFVWAVFNTSLPLQSRPSIQPQSSLCPRAKDSKEAVTLAH